MTTLPSAHEIWTTPAGLRCMVAPYDEDRYQLRLMRRDGTVRSDLFPNYDAAMAAALEWKRHVDDQDQTDI